VNFRGRSLVSNLFFHGTSAQFANSIVAVGARDHLRELGAYELIRELWPVIIDAAGSFPRTANLFDQVGSEFGASAPLGLKNSFDEIGSSTFSYGAFYVSSAIATASRYALRNRVGSELLQFIEDGLDVVRMLKHPLSQSWETKYPDLAATLRQPKHPMVIALGGITAERVLDENGGPCSQSYFDLLTEPGLIFEPSFRVVDVTPEDVVALYDLKHLRNGDALTEDSLARRRMETFRNAHIREIVGDS
jgi:hypothetical protein